MEQAQNRMTDTGEYNNARAEQDEYVHEGQIRYLWQVSRGCVFKGNSSEKNSDGQLEPVTGVLGWDEECHQREKGNTRYWYGDIQQDEVGLPADAGAKVHSREAPLRSGTNGCDLRTDEGR
mmetsp:Transcript_18907/g.54756  ORF Transcript_18907/g.54756 Transcript_18907/m.54756 type:complete len:121 (-) Transcript_18907:1036-1398(-)